MWKRRMDEPRRQRAGSTDAAGGPIHHDASAWGHRTGWPFGRAFARNLRGQGTLSPAEPTSAQCHRLAVTHAPNTERERERKRRKVVIWHAVQHVFALMAFACPVVALALVLQIPQHHGASVDYVTHAFSHCNYNGQFTPDAQPSISMWDISGFFYITVAWGQFAFSTAKFIDIVWDIAVGRLGQALLAWSTYFVSSRYLTLAMSEAPVSYGTYEALAFVPPTLTRTLRLARDLLTNRGWRARLIMSWIILSSLFVITFSSLVTAMSGYSSTTYAVMATNQGKYVPFGQYQVVQFTIYDAERLGEPGPVIMTEGDACLQQGFNEDDQDDHDHVNSDATDHSKQTQEATLGHDAGGDDDNGDLWNYVPRNCTMFWRTVQYVREFGLDGTQAVPSAFVVDGTVHNLTAPTLNITTSYSAPSLSILSVYLEDRSTKAVGDAWVSDITPDTSWIYANETYSVDYVRDHAYCRYSQWHNWGFSFLMLFITTLLLAVWSVGTYALWLFVQLRSAKAGSPPTPPAVGRGIFRSSWDLVDAMQRDLGTGAVTTSMDERAIRGLVCHRRNRAAAVPQGVGQPRERQRGTRESAEPALTEKGESPLSPIGAPQGARRDQLRSWWYPSDHCSRRDTRPSDAGLTLHHSNSTFSSTTASQYPLLGSPGGASFASGMSSLGSPSSIFSFGGQPFTTNLDVVSGMHDRPGSDAGLHDPSKHPVEGLSPTGATVLRPSRPRLRGFSISSHQTARHQSPGLISPSVRTFPITPPSPESPGPRGGPETQNRAESAAHASTQSAMVFHNDLGDDTYGSE